MEASDDISQWTAPKTFEQIGSGPGEDAVDIDPNAWLGQADVPTGYVDVKGGRLKLSAITEGELSALMKQAQKFDKLTKQTRLEASLLRLLVICKSINKANGSNLLPDQLQNKLSGELTVIQTEIFSLSGLNADEEETPKPENFFG